MNTNRAILRAIQREREQSDFVVPSEPKILRLVQAGLGYLPLSDMVKSPYFNKYCLYLFSQRSYSSKKVLIYPKIKINN